MSCYDFQFIFNIGPKGDIGQKGETGAPGLAGAKGTFIFLLSRYADGRGLEGDILFIIFIVISRLHVKNRRMQSAEGITTSYKTWAVFISHLI